MVNILLFSFLFFSFALVANDDYFPVLINPDGTIQPKEYTKLQKQSIETLKKDIQYFQSEISKLLPYLSRKGKIKNNSYTQEIMNFIETQPGRRNQHFVDERFVLNTKEGKLTSISLLKRRTRLSSRMESETVVRTIFSDTNDLEMSKLKLQIDTHTNYTDPKSPISKVFVIKEIPSPSERIKLLRTYRMKVEEVLRELDQIVNRDLLNDHTTISNTLNDVEIE